LTFFPTSSTSFGRKPAAVGYQTLINEVLAGYVRKDVA